MVESSSAIGSPQGEDAQGDGAEGSLTQSRGRETIASALDQLLEQLAKAGLKAGLSERLAIEALVRQLLADGALEFDDTGGLANPEVLNGHLAAVLCRSAEDFEAFAEAGLTRGLTGGWRPGWREVEAAEARVAPLVSRSRRPLPWRLIGLTATGVAAAAALGYLLWADPLGWRTPDTVQIGPTAAGAGASIETPTIAPVDSAAASAPAADEGPAATVTQITEAASGFAMAPTLEELAGAMAPAPGATPLTHAQALHELSGAPLGRPIDLTESGNWLPRLAWAEDHIRGRVVATLEAYSEARASDDGEHSGPGELAVARSWIASQAERTGADRFAAAFAALDDPDAPVDRDALARATALEFPHRINQIPNPPWAPNTGATAVTWADKALVAGAPIAIALLWLLRLAFADRAFLRRRKPLSRPDVTEHIAETVQAVRAGWKDRDKRLAQLLQSREAFETGRIDLDATVEATARAGLWPAVELRYQTLRPSPEYLILIQSDGPDDLEAQRMRALVGWLETDHIAHLDVYHFQTDVAWLRPEAGGRAEPIEAVQAKHPHHRLVVFGTGDGLLSGGERQPTPGAHMLRSWERRAFLTPKPIGEWSQHEYDLARQLDAPVARATRDGALMLGELLGLEGPDQMTGVSERVVTDGDGRLAPLPDLLHLMPERLLYSHRPADISEERLLADLRRALDGAGLDWLAALAVYPALQWDLTLYLGVKLGLYADTPAGDRRLGMLTRLPWLQAGEMPAWVREALIGTLSLKKRGQIYEVIDQILSGDVQPSGAASAAVRLQIGRERADAEPLSQEEIAEELNQDQVLQTFLRRGDKGDYPVRSRQGGGWLGLFAEARIWRALFVAAALGGPAWALTPPMGAAASTGAWLPVVVLFAGAALLLVGRLIPWPRLGPWLKAAKPVADDTSDANRIAEPAIRPDESQTEDENSVPSKPKIEIISSSARIAISASRSDEHIAMEILGEIKAKFPLISLLNADEETPYSREYTKAMNRQLHNSDLFIILMSKNWSDDLIEQSSSMAWWSLKKEASAALSRGVPVVPVLLDGATMPMELPVELKPLASRHAVALNNGSIGHDAQRLLRAIEELLLQLPVHAANSPSAPAEAADPPGPRPLSIFRDPLKYGGEGPEMVAIPAGAFLIGSPEDEPKRDNNEGPQREVTIDRPFALGRFAVTFEEYDAFCAATGREALNDRDWGRGRRPAINVSWEDAQAYCAWLSAESGAEYRLPSEAEWEYACRAGTTTPYWWGAAITPEQANFNGNHVYEGGGEKGVYRKRTEPVDAFEPNPFGLHQVHGNVFEWCADAWNESYDRAPNDGSAWTSGDTSRAVLRGGSWYSDPRSLRSANRFRDQRGNRDSVIGFRVARTLGE